VSLPSLVRSLADNKQLLGLRYADWATRAPSLEADIAAAAMGLDDIGHSRVLYGCLEPLGEPAPPPRRDGFATVALLDAPFASWAEFVAANAVLDTAFTVVIEALQEGSVEVLRARLRKMLMEERYHFLHGRGWLREGADPDVVARAWRQVLELFGPPGGDVDALHGEGAIGAGVEELRGRLRSRVEGAPPDPIIDWPAWDPIRRRTAPGGLDQATFAVILGEAGARA
jgi:ring-1,2-phenylacetyl-CoA epoxidase subunit PaaC